MTTDLLKKAFQEASRIAEHEQDALNAAADSPIRRAIEAASFSSSDSSANAAGCSNYIV